MNKSSIFFISVLAVVLLLISGCGSETPESQLDNLRTGTLALTANFLPNNPPPTVHIEQGIDNEFDVVVEVSNKGMFPQPEDGEKLNGKIYLSGYDKDIIDITIPSISLDALSIDGKSSINLQGGSDLAVYPASISYDRLPVEKYEPTLLATACFDYKTIAGPSVCIDPDPYATISQKKVCNAGDISLSSQGAPVAAVKIDTEAFATKTQFKIAIKNVGNGNVLKGAAGSGQGVLEKCDPYGDEKIKRDDVDKVYLKEVSLGNLALDCWPFAEEPVKGESGYIRLLNGEGSIICEIYKSSYASKNTAYTSPLRIELSYGYKTTAERKLSIKKEGVQN